MERKETTAGNTDRMERAGSDREDQERDPGLRAAQPHGEIELRSEKVRQLLGEIPPSLVRWGTGVIVVVTAALIAAVCLLPYPYSPGESILHHLLGWRSL